MKYVSQGVNGNPVLVDSFILLYNSVCTLVANVNIYIYIYILIICFNLVIMQCCSYFSGHTTVQFSMGHLLSGDWSSVYCY